MKYKRRSIPIGLVLIGGLFMGNGSWIHAKAWLAQILIKQAWSETLQGKQQVKPWPWADTWPVAKLSVAEKGIEYYVLSGASGNALAFGPGHYSGTSLPGDFGTSVIAGHRDTQFRFLKHLKAGDEIAIENTQGITRRYRIDDKQVVDSRQQKLGYVKTLDQLLLVTCYPFDAINPGGPLRLVVTARPE